MADTSAQTLLAAASCYQCNTPNAYGLGMIKLGLLRQILLSLNSMADTTAQTLLSAASCYQCYSANPYMLQMIELGLLQTIAQAGLNVSCQNLSGGTPTSTPSGGCGGPIIDTSNGKVWWYYSGAWH